MLKKLMIGVVVLALVLVVTAVALVAFVDINRFKPQIESFVQQQYGRKLTIDGDLALSLYPNVAVSLPAMSLSEPRAEPTAISVKRARVSVKVIPLLSGKVQADKVVVDGLDATVVRFADGRLSIDDLIGAPTPANGAKPATPAPADGRSASPIAVGDIELGGIAITDGRIVFDDRQAKNRIEIGKLKLETGALADRRETNAALSTDLTMTNPKLGLGIELDTRFTIAFAEQQFDAKTLVLKVRGQFDGMPLDQTISVANLKADATTVRADRLAIAGAVDQGARKLALDIGSPFAVTLADGALELTKLAGEFRLDDKAVAPETIVVPINGSVRANTQRETANVVLDLAARDMKLNARVDVKGFAKPAIAFDVQADRIDVDKFLPPSAPAASPTAGKPASAPAPAGKTAEQPIDLTALDGLDLDGRLRVSELIASGATVRALDLNVKAKGGTATVAPIAAQLYEGRLDGRASVASAGNRLALAANLTGIRIGPLLNDVADTDLLTGKGDLSLDVHSAGATVGAIKQGLNGKASMKLADGAIKGINLGERIRDVRQLLGNGKDEKVASNDQARTDFTALTATFAIANGIATNTDLDGKSPLLRLTGGGTVDIAAGQLDYLAKAAVVGTSKGQGGREVEELKGVTIPVRLSGPFEQLAWAIDWSVAAKEALKSKAAEQLGIDQAAIDAKKAEVKARVDAEEAKLRERADAQELQAREKLKAREQELKDKAAEKLQGLFR